MAAAIVNPTVIRTTYHDGTPRHWGVCERCGDVAELTEAQASSWRVVSLCETCEDDRDAGLFAAEKPEEEPGWFDWARPVALDKSRRGLYDGARNDEVEP